MGNNVRRNYTVEEILSLSKDELWGLPVGGLKIKFPDGSREKLKTRAVIYSSYYWRMYQRFPGGAPNATHSCGNGHYNGDKHLQIMSSVFWDAFLSRPNQTQDEFWKMSRESYEITNELYNDMIIRLSAFMSTLSAKDMVELIEHPEIVEAKRLYKEGVYKIKDVHDISWNLITSDDPALRKNEIRRACSAGLLSRRQITQMIGPRGVIPDINGETFAHPIETGYIEGLHSFHDSLIESRTASISLYMASGPLEASEYNNRQCQLCCSVVRYVTYGNQADCGGKHTIPWRVEKSDVPILKGKFHVVDGKPVMLHGTETELVGQTIQIRSICRCSNKDTASVCMTCVGQNAWTIPPESNLGNHLSIEPQAQISQTILSTKHVIDNAIAMLLELVGTRAKWLSRPFKDDQFLIALKPQKHSYRLRFIPAQAMFLNDVFHTDDVSTLDINSISSIETMTVIEEDKDGNPIHAHELDVTVGGKGSPFSHDFLQHLRDFRWEIVGRNYEVKLDGWDFTKPFIRTNPISVDIMATFNAFKSFLHGSGKPGCPKITNCTSIPDALRQLKGILEGKVKYNFSHLEIFVRPLMAEMEGYGLPHPDEDFRFIPLKEAIHSRGLGAALGFEEQHNLLTSPGSYTRRGSNIPSTPLDEFWDTQGLV